MDGKNVTSSLVNGIDLQQFAAELLTQYEQRQGGKSAPIADMRTIRELFNQFERAEIGLNPQANPPRRKDWRAVLTHKRYILELPVLYADKEVPFGEIPWSSLTPSVGNSWMHRLEICPNQLATAARAKAAADKNREEKVLSPGYRNRILGTLQSILKWHVKEKSIGHNPARGWDRAENPDGGRKGYHTEETAEKLYEKAHPLLTLMAEVSCRTFMRPTETRLLRLSECDFARRVITLSGTRTKNGKTREIPMTKDVFAILDAQRKVIPGEFLFPNPRDPKGGPLAARTVQRWVKTAREDSGVVLNNKELPVFHHFRRTAAVRAVQKKIPEPWIMDVGGWESAAMLRHYAKCTGEALDSFRAMMEDEPKADDVEDSIIHCPICKEPYASVHEAEKCEALCEAQARRQLSPLRRGPRGTAPAASARARGGR